YPDLPESNSARRLLGQIYASGILDEPPVDIGFGARTSIVATLPDRSIRSNDAVVLQDELRAIVGDRVFFDKGGVALGARAEAVIDAEADWIAHKPGAQLVVEGHADDSIDDDGSFALALQRAEIVRSRFVLRGISEDRIKVVSRGASQRIALCPEPECAAQ